MTPLKNAKGQTEEEFLKAYDATRYPCPALSVDMLIFARYNNRLKLLLIRRKNHPYIQQWALPGGFLNIDEDITEAAYRELKEETSINPEQVHLYQLHTYGAVHRDPRMRVISVAHVALINQEIKVVANDDAEDAVWFDVQSNGKILTLKHKDHCICYNIKPVCKKESNSEALAFDHVQMIADALQSLEYTPLADSVRAYKSCQ